MMMNASYRCLPVEATLSSAAHDNVKDRLLGSLQFAIKEVQNVVSSRDPGTLTETEAAVQRLCHSLDRAFLHGLQRLQWGYWDFVKEFTHSNSIDYLLKLQCVTTSLGRSRAWLCLALNENHLESYMQSFLQNLSWLKQYYTQLSLLRDVQRLQVLVTLMAGLEYVTFDLKVDSHYLDKIGFSPLLDRNSSESISGGSCDLSSQGTPSSLDSTTSFQEAVSGILYLDHLDSTVDHDVAIADEDIVCSCADTLTVDNSECENQGFASGVLITSTKSSSILRAEEHNCAQFDVEPDDATVEVFHTIKTRRTKRSVSPNSDCLLHATRYSTKQMSFSTVNFEAHQDQCPASLQSSTSSEGSSVSVTHSSPLQTCSVLRDQVSQFGAPDLSLNLQVDFHIGNEVKDVLNTKSHGRVQSVDNLNSKSLDSWLEERGVPEGQEDPGKSSCTSLSGPDDDTDVLTSSLLCDDEISIYDLGSVLRKGNMVTNSTPEFLPSDCMGVKKYDYQSEVTEVPKQAITKSLTLRRSSSFDESLREIWSQQQHTPKKYELRLGNNALLYLSLEVFATDRETLYKAFLTMSIDLEGQPFPLMFIISSSYLYLLRPGDGECKFYNEASIPFGEIDLICVGLNYQSFHLESRNYQREILVLTGSANLTRSILSHLEIAIRRSGMGVQLPNVLVGGTTNAAALIKALSQERKCEPIVAEFHHYVLVHWDVRSTDETVSPYGPQMEGPLMYQYIHYKKKKPATWTPGYFLLKAGVLYCFQENNKKNICFYIHLSVLHCAGCCRLHSEDRPHVFQLILSNKDTLLLAAANNAIESEWLQAFLETVSLTAKPTAEINTSTCLFCALVLANNCIFMANEFRGSSQLHILGQASLDDLVGLYTDEDGLPYCVLEFECGEADSCSGEWVVYFAGEEEKENFIALLCSLWESLFQVPLNIMTIEDELLLQQCRGRIREIQEVADNIQVLCNDA